MKLSRMLAAATIFSGLSFATAARVAARSAAEATADAEEAASSDDSADTTTTTTTPTTGDQIVAPAATDSDSVVVTPTPGSTDGTTDSAAPPVVVAPAQPGEPMQPVAVPVTPGTRTVVFLPTVSSTDRAQYGYTPPMGIAIMAGGGAFDFVGGTIRGATDMGGFWTVRALLGSRSIVGLEAAYLGTMQGIQSLGLSTDARLISNGVEGMLRLNAPVAIHKVLIEPFAFGGAGWSHYSITRTTTTTASVRDADDVITLPVGGGLELGYNGFFMDARYTYRFSYNNDLVQVGDRGLDNWMVGGALGFEF